MHFMALLIPALLVPFAEGSGKGPARLPTDGRLTGHDIGNFDAIGFADTVSPHIWPIPRPLCKVFPVDPAWPTESEWSRLNETLDGALLQPLPPASACDTPSTHEPTCETLVNGSQTADFFDDPVKTSTQWPQGNTCPALRNATGVCTQGGYPAYVVNATAIKHIQAAVNFARNKYIRLIIKNTGHDFVGRSLGAGSLSIWTHFLKEFQFLPDYRQPGGVYHGPAALVGAGLQVWEAFKHAERHNITLPGGACLTVGSYGGWFTGGGHSPLSSKFGLGVDQVLSLQVVTADGRYVTVDPQTNQDLFFAMRGGGGSTYGVVTSATVKAHPQINLTIASFNFTLGDATSTTPGPNVTVADAEAFWRGFNQVFAFGIPTVDAGGYLWTICTRVGNGSYSMQVRVQLPGFTPAGAAAFVKPLLYRLNRIGIPTAITTPTTQVYSSQTESSGRTSNAYFASRLFPRKAYQNPVLFAAAMAAARAAVEAGYIFHGLNMAPTLRVAGDPAPAGLNPVWRDIVMHADVIADVDMATLTPAEQGAVQHRLNGYMDALREATPGGGAYFNEADILEPNWQQSFFGSNYGELRRIKSERDPWHVFWAPKTPGSEAWAVQSPDELPTQNGRLCRVE